MQRAFVGIFVFAVGQVGATGCHHRSPASEGTPGPVVASTAHPPGEPARPRERLPILDVHHHAFRLADFGTPTEDGGLELPTVCGGDDDIEFPGVDPREPMTIAAAVSCRAPLTAPATEEALVERTLATFARNNMWVVTAGTPETLERWRALAPERIIPALDFAAGRDDETGVAYPPPSQFRAWHADGRFEIFAEVGAQYAGLSPADEALEPYFALAEELDIPVGLHLGEGPPGAPHVGLSSYRVSMGRPLLLEEVLLRHPKLRVYVMHYGSPFIDEMMALLYSHPQVFVDIAGNNWMLPRKQFHDHLRRLVEAGYGKRVLFGSDSLIWPQAIDIAIESIETAEFLTQQQRRDILYGNAARFLRLSEEEIARHHAP